jgi:putative oxidoreductase
MTTTVTTEKKHKGLNIALWVLQSLLAAMFLMAGSSKTFQAINELANMLPWVTQVPEGLVRFIGASELLGGLGLLLPSLLKIKPILTPIAAFGIALVMLFAAFFHISRGENSAIGANFLFMAIALFIAWGRMKKVPIQAK